MIKIYTKDIFISDEAAQKLSAEEGDKLIVNYDEEENLIEVAIAPKLGLKDGFLLTKNNGKLRTTATQFRKIPKGNYRVLEPNFDGNIDWFELEIE